jgi:hypothetical protein
METWRFEMSFGVFASGSGGFHYQKDKFFDGDGFETLQILSTMLSMEHTKLGVVDAVREHYVNGDMADAAPALAKREFLNALTETVDLLSIRTGSGNGFIAVTAKNAHGLWPDTIRVARYGFDPGDSPGVEFFKAIARNLDDTSLKTWGVVMALTIVLSEFLDHLNQRNDASLPTMVNIFLTR